MPRVAIKKKDYMIQDMSAWIHGRMRILGYRQADMAKLINISQPAFSHRLEVGLFTYAELITILQELKATDEEILRLMKL